VSEQALIEASNAGYAQGLKDGRATAQPAAEELVRALCAIGVVGQIDGHDVVRRSSVIEIAERRR
jgi:hypothetical protein